MPTARDLEIKELVRTGYARIASEAARCCETTCCSDTSELYKLDQIEGLPGEAVAASAGCGNPTALASLKRGETVVDLGSGGGIDCFLAARAVGPQGRVIGLDMTPKMIDLARSNVRKLGLRNVEFHLTEMEHSPIPDGSADVIISNCVINLAPDKDAVFKEAYRILRAGGRIFVSDMLLTEELPAEAKFDNANWVACLSGAELKETYLERMRDAGFKGVATISETPFEGAAGWRSRVISMDIRAVKPL